MRPDNALTLVKQVFTSAIAVSSPAYMFKDSESVGVRIKDKDFVRISDKKFVVAKKIDLTDKLSTGSDRQTNLFYIDALIPFLGEIAASITKLNHIGLGYYCSDIDAEKIRYNYLLKDSMFTLYEELSDDQHVRWLFIKENNDVKVPMFELVLLGYPRSPHNLWVPHFQIDLDTDLAYEDIETITKKYFGSHFIRWKLQFPHYGVVAVMGLLGVVCGLYFWLGLGTGKRRAQQLERL